MIVGQFQSEAQSEQRMQLNRSEDLDRFKQLSTICPQILLNLYPVPKMSVSEQDTSVLFPPDDECEG